MKRHAIIFLTVVHITVWFNAIGQHAGGHLFRPHADDVRDPYPYVQIKTQDLELLAGINLEKRLGKHFVLGLNYQTRIDNYITTFKATLAEGSFKYKMNKFISFKTGLRYAYVAQTDMHGWKRAAGSQTRAMFATYFRWKKKDYPLRLQARLRVENEWVSENSNEYTFLRARLNASFNYLKWATPYLSIEPFNDPRAFDQIVKLIRYEAGVDWKVGKIASLNTFYRLEVMNDYFKGKVHMVGIVWDGRFK